MSVALMVSCREGTKDWLHSSCSYCECILIRVSIAKEKANDMYMSYITVSEGFKKFTLRMSFFSIAGA